MKILITGGSGKLAKEIVDNANTHEIISLSKDVLNVYYIDQIESAIKTYQPDVFIHAGALTRPMIKHIETPNLSIQSNIIGTSNVVLMCMKYNIKLVYISTDYIYPCTDGNYSETDPILPVNEYAWSKLGGECAVKLYKNSLILRMALCQKPFPHPKALADIKKSYMYMDTAANIIIKLIDKFGIINVGGDAMSPYEFAKKDNTNIEKIYLSDINDVNMGKDSSLNITKLKQNL
jgi:dTDP-4-dehydrorhamnose reductase